MAEVQDAGDAVEVLAAGVLAVVQFDGGGVQGHADTNGTGDVPGGVAECALVLEVMPPFEQDDDAVLDDLVASVTYWREALERRGVLAD